MNVSKKDVLQIIEDLSESELRIVYTFIEEFRIAESERYSYEIPNKDTSTGNQ